MKQKKFIYQPLKVMADIIPAIEMAPNQLNVKKLFGLFGKLQTETFLATTT